MKARTGKFSGIDNTDTLSRVDGWMCPLCCEVFSGEKNFAWHRLEQVSRPGGNVGSRILGECRHPESKGMILRAGIWVTPKESPFRKGSGGRIPGWR
jgi:hypothetical protein